MTVKESKIGFVCGQYPIIFLVLSKSVLTSCYPIKTVPSVDSISFIIILNVVDLPAPLTPKRAKHSPQSKPNDKFSTAT